MATFKELAEKVANVINKPFNHELKERIKDSFKQVLATRIKQSFDQNGIDDRLKLNYDLELEEYNKISNSINKMFDQNVSIKDINYRLITKDKVLPSIRFKNEAPFTKVSTIGGVSIPYFSNIESTININSPFKSQLSYNLDNGYIVITSTIPEKKINIRYINIESIFEDFEKVLNYYDYITSDEDVLIPFPNDMIESIFNEILKSEFGIIQVEENNVPLNNEK